MKTRIVLCAALLVGMSGAALAEYPEKPITLVVPFPAGSPVDQSGRLLAQALEDGLGQSVIVENKPGASGETGSASVAQAASDGYTLLWTPATSTAIAEAIKPNLRYKPSADFIPTLGISVTGLALQVNDKVPVKTCKEFLDYVLANPDKLTFATAGIASTTHLAAEVFMQRAGAKMVHIPYKGSPPANVDLIAGNVDVQFGPNSTARSNSDTGKVRVLCLLGPARVDILPGIPTAKEAGVPELEQDPSWFGLFAPTGTPADVVKKIQDAVVKGMATDAATKQLTNLGMVTNVMVGDVFAKRFSDDITATKELVEKAGIKIE